MYFSPEFLVQVAAERGQALRASAAAHRLVEPVPTRRRIARSLRRAADRFDSLTPASGAVRTQSPDAARPCPVCG